MPDIEPGDEVDFDSFVMWFLPHLKRVCYASDIDLTDLYAVSVVANNMLCSVSAAQESPFIPYAFMDEDGDLAFASFTRLDLL